MRVPQPAVLVTMRVRLSRRIADPMRMTVMFVVDMRVRMSHGLVNVLVLVTFGDV